MLLTNFSFISLISFYLSYYCDLHWLLVARSHFWRFSDVQNGNQREVTGKCQNFLKPKETNERKSLFASGDRKRAFVLSAVLC